MQLHSYIVEHDVGFAPNPFHGFCTLADCKPKIRCHAKVGDYIVGTGTKKHQLHGRLIYIMRVGEIVNFDQYWTDARFARKKAVMNGSLCQAYGDNIYHRDQNCASWIQEDSFHSRAGGLANLENMKVDTGTTDRVLIADWFIYWGRECPQIPMEFERFVQKTQGHKSINDEHEISSFTRWASSAGPDNVVVGEPSDWSFEERRALRTRSSAR